MFDSFVLHPNPHHLLVMYTTLLLLLLLILQGMKRELRILILAARDFKAPRISGAYLISSFPNLNHLETLVVGWS